MMPMTERYSITPGFLKPRMLARKDISHKRDYGHLLIVAGCRNMPGAAVLATGAALKSGCGLVTLHSTERALQAVVNNYPSAILSEDAGYCFSTIPEDLQKYTAIAAGPGLGHAPQTVSAFTKLLEGNRQAGLPMVLDADAINILALYRELLEMVPPRSVFTPHLGELRRLLPHLSDDQFSDASLLEDAVLGLCRRTRSVIVVKGFHTKVYDADVCLENTSGGPGLAKGGSGDVLTGLIGGLMARGYPALDAAALGVWLHGHAGDVLSERCTAEAFDSMDLISSLFNGFKVLL